MGDYKKSVTTHVVRLKPFRLKAEGVRKARLTHVAGERAVFRTKHGFKMSGIPIFPNRQSSDFSLPLPFTHKYFIAVKTASYKMSKQNGYKSRL